jgi:hypothetical protein
MSGSATQIHDALSMALAAVPGLRVADHLPEGINPPMAIIQVQSVTYHRAMQGGLSEWQYLVAVVSGRMGDRSAQRLLDGWMAYDGSQSIRAAIEADPTLNGICQTLLVADMVSVRPLSQGDAEYLSCEFNVTVHA